VSSFQLPADHAERLERARLSLDGLPVGDAFGECFFSALLVKAIFELRRVVPTAPWRYTDDTEMALAIEEVLQIHGAIDQDDLAKVFSRRFRNDPRRGYGATAREIMAKVNGGMPWRKASSNAFGGEGSMGNGAAMRVAPLGAYFAEDTQRLVAEARASAEVTHGHPEGQAGAIAVAIAAAYAWRVGAGQERHAPGKLLDLALTQTPAGETCQGIAQARQLPPETPVPTAAQLLGSGQRVTSPDTVPFCLWCADRHLDSYEEAIWNTVAGLGDRDTTCAIVGGIVVLATGRDAIPPDWLRAREPLA